MQFKHQKKWFLFKLKKLVMVFKAKTQAGRKINVIYTLAITVYMSRLWIFIYLCYLIEALIA